MKYMLLLFFGTLMFSQNIRFTYEVLYKKDSTSAEVSKDIYYLEVDADEMRYYNRMYYVNDSLYSATEQFGYKGYKLSSFIVRKTNEQTYNSYEYIGDVNFYKTTEVPQLDWKITDSTKIFEGFIVQKATLKFGGRDWTVWFCKDIPFPYGPYKFNGLPGLITELQDKGGNYYFKLVESKNEYAKYKHVSLEYPISHSIPVNMERLNKLKLELYNNPFKYVLNGKLSIPEGKKLQLEDGTILSKEELKPAEKKERFKIKNDNNPIELDKAVKYPK